jgi:hypothetical protein
MTSATTAGRDATPGSDEWREAVDVSQLTVLHGARVTTLLLTRVSISVPCNCR